MSKFKFQNFGDFVKSVKRPFSVIPAPVFTGINSSRNPVLLAFRIPLDSRFHGNDDFLRFYQFLDFGIWHPFDICLPAAGRDFDI